MFSHAAISGSPKEGVYSQTLISGNFYFVLSLEGKPEEVNLELGRNTLSKIEEIISQTPEISPKELVEMQQEEFANGVKINILAAKIEGQKISLACTGAVIARLFRKGKIVNLTADFLIGTLFDEDLLVLTTSEFFSHFPLQDLASHFSLPTSEIKDSILPEIESLENNSRLAALFLKIDLQEELPADFSDHESPSEPQSAEPASPAGDLPPRSSHPITSNLTSFVSGFSPHFPRPFSHPSLYLRRPSDPNAPTSARRKILYLSLVILVSLVSLIVFQLRSRVLEEKSKAVAAIGAHVQEGINSAHKLTGLNDKIAYDVLIQTKADALAASQKTFGDNPPADLVKILANLDREIAAVSHVNNVSKLDLFYDFSLLKSGVKITSAWAHKDESVALDTSNGAVYSLNLSTKGAGIALGQEAFKKGKFIDFSGTSIYVWTPDGIISVDRSISPASAKVILKPSDQWGSVKNLKVYVGNVYLLDSVNNQIWKYQKTDFGFASVSAYLTAKSVDFSNAESLAIDGSINVLTSTGNIARFTAGLPENFKITGLPAEASAKAGLDGGLKNPVSFFATDDTQNIYILDSNGTRVVVLDKKGAYISQYLLPSPFTLSPKPLILVSESLKKIFLFSDSKVFSFNLQ